MIWMLLLLALETGLLLDVTRQNRRQKRLIAAIEKALNGR